MCLTRVAGFNRFVYIIDSQIPYIEAECDMLVSKLLGFETFPFFLMVSVSVSEIFGIGQSIGIGFEFSNSKLCHFSSPLHPIHTDLFPQPSLSRKTRTAEGGWVMSRVCSDDLC